MKLRSKAVRVSAVLATVAALGGGSLAVAGGAFAAATAYTVTVNGGGTIVDVDTRSSDDTCQVTIQPPAGGIVVSPGGAPFEFTQEFPACDDEIYGSITFVFSATDEGALAVTAGSQLFYDRCVGSSCSKVTAATGSATYSVRSDGVPYARELVVPQTETAGARYILAFSSTPQG